jgi:hypothetical protein
MSLISRTKVADRCRQTKRIGRGEPGDAAAAVRAVLL